MKHSIESVCESPKCLSDRAAAVESRFDRRTCRRRIGSNGLISVIVVASFVGAAKGQTIPPEQVKFFENEVRPLLAAQCFKCHGEEKQSGKLRLDSRGWMIAGGESGEAIVPGKPDESLLIEAINYESYEMPPTGKLSDAEIATLTRWVAIGAPWPGEDPNAPIRKRDLFDEVDRSWWAIQPVADPEPPSLPADIASWARNEIDHFVVDAMKSEGLAPAPEADRITLARRLYSDVIGLPPTPEQVDAFVNDPSPDAYERLVDSLLDSEAYGEHAARQWLDLVRYADSDGYRADEFRPYAFRYRDYVIRSLNDDKPYDRFVQEQLAGDELFPDDLDAQVALGYLRHWVYEWNIRDARTQWKTILDDVTDTTADAFLGLGLQCAKCHNHKFDPLLQKDYFRLQAFLAPILPRDITIADPKTLAEFDAKQHAWEEKTQAIRSQIAEIEQPYRDKYRNIAIDRFPDDLNAIARKPAGERSPLEEQLAYLVQRQVEDEYERLESYMTADDRDRVVALRRELKAFDAVKPSPLPVAMAVTDVGPVAPPSVLPKRPDEIIDPGAPSILDPNPMPITADPSQRTTGRRSALAMWITDPTNPLSTRVIANRIWQSHFGRGLAENPSDFGRLGGPPSHPQLLDWLTSRLIEDGWSLKSLHRRILLSATYRQSTQHPQFAAYQQIDPTNRLYWRRDTTRLTAEQIRDSLLAVTGQLKPRHGGAPVLPDQPYRSIYTREMRNSPDELMGSFDLPQFFASNSTRNTTTTPIQSLLMINSDLMLGHSRALASRLQAASVDVATQVDDAWRLVYGRRATSDELQRSLRFIEDQRREIAAADSAKSEQLIETAKLPYRDGQAVKFLIDDPTLTLSVPHDPAMNVNDFTIEAFFELRSIASDGAVRTIVGKWDGSSKGPGWRFGVTGAGSRRKPQTIVLHMYGTKADGSFGEAAIFSDQHVDLNTPYYASASFHAARDGQPGSVTFYLKDLSNDDEPLLIAEISHDVAGGFNNTRPLTLGSGSGSSPQSFDGLIDDVRLVARDLSTAEILYTVERPVDATIGFWRFESDPGVMRNSSADRLHISARGKSVLNLTPDEAALADFCHALLNSNEFLYVH